MYEKPSAKGACPYCGKPVPTRQHDSVALPLRSKLRERYLIGVEKGKGGSGITYSAYDLKENKRVVIKELFPDNAVTRLPGHSDVLINKDCAAYFFIQIRRFIEEAKMISALSGTPQIVDIYHCFTANNTAYYSMEYLSGNNLLELLCCKYNGKMPWQALKPVINDDAAALKVVHDSGAVHRDISPDNIFVLEDGRAKLIDFGAARPYGRGKRLTEILKKTTPRLSST